MISNHAVSIGLLIVTLASTGCGPSEAGPERVTASGTVTGVANGTISFLPAEGTTGPSATASIVDGRYCFDKTNGPVAGSYNVVIVPRRDIPKGNKDQAGTSSRPIKPPAGESPADATPKPLAATVNKTSTRHDFEVK